MRGTRLRSLGSVASATLAVAVGAAVLAPMTARAQGAQVEYSVLGECPDAQAFRDAVLARAGRDVIGDGAGLVLRVAIARSDARLRGSVQVGREGIELGHRDLEVEPGSCADLVEALGLSVALLLDEARESLAVESPPPGADPPEALRVQRGPARPRGADGAPPCSDPSGALRIQHGPARPSGADGAPPGRTAPRFGAPCSDPERDAGDGPRASTGASARLSLSAVVIASAGVLPDVGLGGALFGGVELGPTRFGAELRVSVANGRGMGDEALETGVATLAPSGCVRERFLVACVALRLGAVWGRGPELAQPRTSVAFFASAAAHAGLVLDVVPEVVSVDLAVELEVPFTPVSFESGGQSLWRSSWLAGALRLGVTAAVQ